MKNRNVLIPHHLALVILGLKHNIDVLQKIAEQQFKNALELAVIAALGPRPVFAPKLDGIAGHAFAAPPVVTTGVIQFLRKPARIGKNAEALPGAKIHALVNAMEIAWEKRIFES